MGGKALNDHPEPIALTRTHAGVHHARPEQTQKGAAASTDYTLDAMIRKLITSPIHPAVHQVPKPHGAIGREVN